MSSTQSYCDGRIGITTVAEEMRMSHWVHSPVVLLILPAGEVLCGPAR